MILYDDVIRIDLISPSRITSTALRPVGSAKEKRWIRQLSTTASLNSDRQCRPCETSFSMMKTSLTVLPSWTCNLLHQGVKHPSPPHLALLSHPPVERGQRRRGSLRLTRPISALPNRTRTCSSLVGPNDPIRCSYSFA